MSRFYQQPKHQPNPLENQSIVRPYNQQKPSFYTSGPAPAPAAHAQKKQHTTFRKQEKQEQKEEDGLRKSIALANNDNEQQSWLTKCCSCANLEGYKKFFHVTNSAVTQRIMLNLQFWKVGFFGAAPDQQIDFDFYGPFWIYTTLVFCLSAVPNILLYQGVVPFEYNFEIVGLAFGFVYLEGFLFPLILTFILKMLGVECTYIQNVCIYGYSMCACVICILLCSFNSCIMHFVLLGYGFTTKAWFILNNMLNSYAIPIPKKALIGGLVIGEAVLQFLVVKIFFINCVNDAPTTTTTTPNHLLQHYFSSRTFLS